MRDSRNNDAITWLQFNNIVPVVITLITTIFSVATIYYQLNAKVDLAIQKLDFIAQKVSDYQQEAKEIQVMMRENREKRNAQISDIYSQIASIKTLLKIQ